MSQIAVLLLLLLTGCSTVTELPATADGQRQLLVSCGVMFMSACAKRAAKECANGYDLVEADRGYSANSMQIRCRA
jgi:hypothetical protein